MIEEAASRARQTTLVTTARENAMKDFAESRREFLKTTGAIAGGFLL
jgi:hypothetical protein